MRKKECFENFILTQKCQNKEDFIEAKIYYNEASSLERKKFEVVCSSLGRVLFNFYINEEYLKIKTFLRLHNIDPKEISYLIAKYTPKEPEAINILDYWSLTTKNIAKYLENIFNMCLATGWKKEELEKVATSLFINYDVLIQVLNEYLNKYNQNNNINIGQILYEIKCASDFKRFLDNYSAPTKEAFWYYENKANEEMRKQYEERVNALAARTKLKLNNEPKNKDQNSEDQILGGKYYKFSIMLLEANIEDIDKFVLDNKIRLHYFRSDYLPSFIKIYAKHHSESETNSFLESLIAAYNKYLKHTQNKANKYYQFCLMLLNCEELTKLKEFATTNVVNLLYFKNKYLKRFIAEYQTEHSEEETQKALEIIITNFNDFQATSTKPIDCNITEEELLKLKYRFTTFTHGNSFKVKTNSQRITNISIEEENLISQIDPQLYELYKARKSRRLFLDIRKIDELVNYLQNGIISNNEVRPFDIIDYYLIFRTPLECILAPLKVLSSASQQLILSFYNKNTLLLVKGEDLMSLDIEVNCQKDESGFPIPQTGTLATKEEKEQIIKYLIMNDIPLTSNIYRVAIKRYFAGTLNIPVKPSPTR